MSYRFTGSVVKLVVWPFSTYIRVQVPVLFIVRKDVADDTFW